MKVADKSEQSRELTSDLPTKFHYNINFRSFLRTAEKRVICKITWNELGKESELRA